MSIHRSGSKPLIISEAYGRKLTPTTSRTNEESLTDSTPYFDASAIKDFNNTKPNSGSNNNGTSWSGDVAKKWKKFSSWTIGNRRLKMYIYSILKFATITYVQANDVLGKASNTNNQTERDMQMAFKILSYLYMFILIALFTFRYVRELIAIQRKTPLSIWVNWIESTVYLTYFCYSIVTSVIHVVYITKHYNVEYEERLLHPENFAYKTVTLEEELAVEILEVFVHLYIIVDKGTHYLHAGHSVSLYLAKAQHLPKHHQPGHDQSQNHYQDNFDHHAHLYTNRSESEEDEKEKSDEEYDDFVGKLGSTKGQPTRRHTVMTTPSKQSYDSELLLEEPKLAFNKF